VNIACNNSIISFIKASYKILLITVTFTKKKELAFFLSFEWQAQLDSNQR
jgi:hypothetical protein